MPTSSDDWITQLRQLAGGEQRIRVLAALAAHPEPLFHRQIMDAIEDSGHRIHPTGLGKILRDLETLGYITGDLPSDLRHGRTVRYTIDHAAVRGVLDAARRGLTPTKKNANRAAQSDPSPAQIKGTHT